MMFGLKRFRGGVHPDEHKELSGQFPIQTDLPLPERLYLPLYQQAGAESRAIVEAGAKVLKGQCVAVSGTGLSANLHAPTSGTIVGIEEVVAPHPSGLTTRALVIESDGDDRWMEIETPANPFETDPDLLAQRVGDAGVVGLGGAIFPTAVKLRQGRRFEIKTLLINGGECEPFLTTDDRLMRERAEDIVTGVRLVRHILEAYRAVICIENNKPEAIEAIRRAAEPHGSIEVVVVPARYPMGSAKQMIQAVTGQEVPAGHRSNDLGILVQNIGTIYAIKQALFSGRPMISRVTTVSGSCIAKPQNVETLLGTPVRHLIEQCGGLIEPPERLLMGGPMMGQRLNSLDSPIIKGASAVLALAKKELNQRDPSPCIRCDRCVSACPMGLVPQEMARSARADNFDRANEFGLRDCILCGSCSYVCPSHIPLVQYFEYAKGELGSRRRSENKLAFTQQLTEQREQRLAREAAAKEAARAAKAAAKAAKKKKREAAKAAEEA